MRLLLFAALFFASLAAQAARTDTVYLYNGDRVTGEVKYLRDNRLSFKTDRAGTINVEWPSIMRIYSNNYFDIVTSNYQRYFGRLLYGADPRTVIVELGTFSEQIALDDIVSIERVKTGFFNQLTGTITLSGSFTKANQNVQLNGGFDITHRTRKYQNNISANAVFTNSATQEVTERTNVGYNFNRLYNNAWFVGSGLSYQHNTELNIDSRYQLFAGGGYYFVRKPGIDFSGTTGLSGNNEQSIEEPRTYTQNLEYVAALKFHQFKFRDPQIDIYATVTTYTSLNVPGRFRFDGQVTFLLEIVKDLKWNVTYYNNFDNKPPGGSNVQNDWSLLTGFTYSL